MNIPAYWGKLCTYNVICSFQGHHSTVSTLRDILFTQTWTNVLISKSGMDHHFILPTHQIPYNIKAIRDFLFAMTTPVHVDSRDRHFHYKL